MKRTIFGAVAIVASVGMAASALAQNQSNYRYSSYGNTQEAAAQESSPSDVPIQEDAVAPPATTAVAAPASAIGSCDTGCSSYLDGGSAGNCGGGGCGVGSGVIHGNSRNITFGLRGLIFTRDYEDDRGLGSNAFGESLFSTSADHDSMGGFETFFGSRGCNGSGWEVGYWGLYPDRADTTFAGAPLYTELPGLSQVDLRGADVATILNTSDTWRLYRFNEFHNLEFNLLRNAGSVQGFCGGCTNIEWLAGLRWFSFREDMRLAAFNTTGTYPLQTNYDVNVDNNLIGFQLGARADRCLSNCLSLSLGFKFGVYQNDIQHFQAIRAGNGENSTIGGAGPYAGDDYGFGPAKKEVSTLGELDLGINWNFRPCWRMSVGYRAVGVAGVALAPDQIPYSNFEDAADINRINSNGDLLLHGAYFGIEHSF